MPLSIGEAAEVFGLVLYRRSGKEFQRRLSPQDNTSGNLVSCMSMDTTRFSNSAGEAPW